MSNTRYKGRKLLQDNGNRSRFLQSLASESIVSSDMRIDVVQRGTWPREFPGIN